MGEVGPHVPRRKFQLEPRAVGDGDLVVAQASSPVGWTTAMHETTAVHGRAAVQGTADVVDAPAVEGAAPSGTMITAAVRRRVAA